MTLKNVFKLNNDNNNCQDHKVSEIKYKINIKKW